MIASGDMHGAAHSDERRPPDWNAVDENQEIRGVDASCGVAIK
jgi:hypothetical protein